MKKLRIDSLAYQVKQRIETLPSVTVVRADIEDLGEYRQISRALLTLVKRGMLIPIAYGVYTKARYSNILKKPVISGGFKEVACNALDRLGVRWEASKVDQDYNAGRSTQVPVRAVVKLKSRCRRTISWEGMQLKYE